MDRYGVTHPSKSKIIQERTQKIFLEKYGVKNPFQSEQIKEKIRQTCLKHFNVFIYVKYVDICYHIIAMENQNDNKNLTEFIVDEIKPIEGFEKVEIKKKKDNQLCQYMLTEDEEIVSIV